jgi:hypothetical protein
MVTHATAVLVAQETGARPAGPIRLLSRAANSRCTWKMPARGVTCSKIGPTK